MQTQVHHSTLPIFSLRTISWASSNSVVVRSSISTPLAIQRKRHISLQSFIHSFTYSFTNRHRHAHHTSCGALLVLLQVCTLLQQFILRLSESYMHCSQDAHPHPRPACGSEIQSADEFDNCCALGAGVALPNTSWSSKRKTSSIGISYWHEKPRIPKNPERKID